MKRREFFAFAINEYRWQRVRFTRHFSRTAAERRHRVRFTAYEDPVSADLSVIILEGRDALERWAEECNYDIDWRNGCLVTPREKP